MKLLLDTHTFIWWDSTPAKLSAAALALCSDPDHQLVLSVTSLWEMQIKRQLGKLELRLPLAEIVAHQEATNGVTLLDVDRLLVAQAIIEKASLISADPALKSYPVEVLW